MSADPDHANRVNSIKGYFSVMAAAVLWASSGTVSKLLFQEGISPFGLTQMRVTFASLILFIVLVTFARGLLRIRWQDFGYFILLGSGVMAMVQGTYLYTISKIQVAAAILIQYMAPIMVAIFSIFFWKERPTPFKLISLTLAIGGCYLVVGGYNLELLRLNRLGIMAGLASAFFFASYSLLGERGMHRYAPWTILFYALVLAVPTWHILYPPFYYVKNDLGLFQWILVFYISLMGTVAPFGLYFLGVNYIRSTRASITATLEPIMAGGFAFLLLGEMLELPQILGGMSVIGAIVLLQVKQERDAMTPALIRSQRREEERQ